MASKGKGSKRLSPARKDFVLKRFGNAVGEEELNTVLSCSGDARAERLLGMLQDPAFQGFSFPRICERAGMGVTDLVGMFRDFHSSIAVIGALQHLPKVIEELCEDAKSRIEVCDRCDGRGSVEDPREPDGVRCCPRCKGACEVRVPGDHRSREMFLKIVGLLPH